MIAYCRNVRYWKNVNWIRDQLKFKLRFWDADDTQVTTEFLIELI